MTKEVFSEVLNLNTFCNISQDLKVMANFAKYTACMKVGFNTFRSNKQSSISRQDLWLLSVGYSAEAVSPSNEFRFKREKFNNVK